MSQISKSLSVAVILAGSWPALAAETVDFSRDIRPLLSDRCFACHGPDANARQANLRLDKRDEALGHVIQPGDVDGSDIIRRITSDDPEERMPPPDSNKTPLSAAEVDMLRHWVQQGAPWREHWAFVAPVRPAIPTVEDRSWPVNAIDFFLLSEFESTGTKPSPPAARRTLLRRLYFDVLGLPPSPFDVRDALSTVEDWDTFYQRRVDELLQSPAFGERMAAYWLDVVRYADSCGIHGDQLMSMSPYRDYVITALNNNMPFDRFVTEQLAGDLLPGSTLDQKIASAFNRLHMITAEGGAQNKEYLAIYAADRVRNTSTALMGVTMGCAQCHDHKFDPFTMKEFYQFAAFFADLKETGVYGGNNWYPKMLVPTDEETAELQRLNELVAAAEQRFADVNAEVERLRASQQSAENSADENEADAAENDKRAAAETSSDEEPSDGQLAELQKQLEEKRKTAENDFNETKKKRDTFRNSIRSVVVSEAVEPREMRILPRGNWLDDSGAIVQPDVPRFLLPLPNVSDRSRRLSRMDLAAWLTQRNHPLVARVFVNRLWKLFYGRGIVSTLDDFGFQGDSPTYPELLDWLAIEFVDSGWDVKHMVRLMVTARAYRQSSRVTELMRVDDPLNLMFARQSRFRLDAEMIRDNALMVSGLLVGRVGGRSVRPYQPAGYYAHLNFPRRTYQSEKDDNLWRRTVYTHWQRTFLHPSLRAFDAPTREECTAERPRSNTPLQSLVLLNDPIYVEAARALAERTLSEARSSERRIHALFQFALQRDASNTEIATLSDLLVKHKKRFAADPASIDALLSIGASSVRADLDRAELAAWSSLSRVVLNLHEFIVRY